MAVRKKKRRGRRRGSFLFSLFTFLVIAGAILGSVAVFLRVGNIEVNGNLRYSDAELIETSGIKNGDNLMFMNKFEVAEKILNEYPYIEKITIKRRLPDTFVFTIVERVPVAYVEYNGNRWLIDEKAYVLEMIPESATISLPKVEGAEIMAPHEGDRLSVKDSDQLPALRDVLSSIRSSEMTEKIVRIDVSKLYNIKLVYGKRFLVTLGDNTSIPKKIEMLRAVIAELTEADRGTINVSAVKEARFKPDIDIDLGIPAEEEVTTEEDVTTESTAAEESEGESETGEEEAEEPEESTES